MAIRLTAHAQEMLEERRLSVSWVESTISHPDFTRPDPIDAALTRAFRSISEAGDRLLRVVYRQDGEDAVVITAHFDRGARP